MKRKVRNADIMYVHIYIRNCEMYPLSYPYFDVLVGLAWSNDPESYTGGSIVTGRAFHARQVKRGDPNTKGYPSSPGWGLL
jgi:hypothetical protein